MTKKNLNKNLHQAKNAKQDEFYTQLNDIASELRHYESYFENKTVYCNCDDPRVSQFFNYFTLKFKSLKLKKLITTCYKNQNPDLFSQNEVEKAIYLEYKRDKKGDLTPYPEYMQLISKEADYKGDKNNPNIPQPEDIGVGYLKGDGDFRSKECVELLKQADIVVTNPPFSLFRKYMEQLIQYDKKFVIIGNKNTITYKEVFKLIKENKIWVGNTPMGVDMLFDIPENIAQRLKKTKKEGSGYKIVNGMIKGRSQSIWFTNLEHLKRNEDLKLGKKYKGNEKDYPKYDNYDAINVDKVIDIPEDYKGAMGVPITFLDKYNPDQFEIIALGIVGSIDFSCNKKMEILDKNGNPTGKFTLNAKGTLYRKYNPQKDKKPAFKDCVTNELYSSIYARIIIKNKRL